MTTPVKDGILRTAREVVVALGEKYAPPEYAFFEQVRNGTGYQRRVRTADAMAMSLWPSRGLHLHGFEVKVSRQDWTRELANPAKAEDLAAYCDRWWIVVGDPKIVQDGELPPTWGLIVPAAGRLKVKTDAPPLTPKPFDRTFFASLMRCAHEVKPDRAELQAEYTRGFDAGKTVSDRDWERLTSERDELTKAIDSFEKASGVSIRWGDRKRIGEAVRLVLQGGHLQAKRYMETMREGLVRTMAALDKELEALG